MKLSMWILAERFSSFEIRYDIQDEDAEISGVRFISEELNELSSEYVYVGKCSDVLSDPDYESTVILVHGHDLMFIENQSAEDILNETLAAFDFYNRWENSLWAAAAESNPIQSMVDISENVMNGPLGIADTNGRLIAYTKDETLHPQNEGWQYILDSMLVPNTYASSQIRDVNGNLLNDWPLSPQKVIMESSTCIGSQVVAGDEIVGAFYLEQYKKELTPGDVQLARVFCEILSSLSTIQGAHTEVRTTAALVGSLLKGEAPDDALSSQLDKLLVKPPPYQLLVIRSATSSVNIVRKNTLLETIKSLGRELLSLIYEDDIVCIIADGTHEQFLQQLRAQVKLQHYALGVSLPFSAWEQVSSRYKQTQFVFELTKNTHGVFACRDYALDGYINEVEKCNLELDLAHPALAILREYDSKNSTELFATLKRYLQNERNMVKTAEELCIHRNSMKYRMRRIRELIDADLADPSERLYLLISFALVQ